MSLFLLSKSLSVDIDSKLLIEVRKKSCYDLVKSWHDLVQVLEVLSRQKSWNKGKISRHDLVDNGHIVHEPKIVARCVRIGSQFSRDLSTTYIMQSN